MPLSAPFAASESPGGRYEPAVSVHVTAPVPPVAVNVCEYATVTFPNGKVVVLIESGVTFNVNCRAA